jgi:hypothetical protein
MFQFFIAHLFFECKLFWKAATDSIAQLDRTQKGQPEGNTWNGNKKEKGLTANPVSP